VTVVYATPSPSGGLTVRELAGLDGGHEGLEVREHASLARWYRSGEARFNIKIPVRR
jgi:hypothetical protein